MGESNVVDTNIDSEESSANVPALLLALVSFVVYWFYLRPTAPNNNRQQQPTPQQQAAQFQRRHVPGGAAAQAARQRPGAAAAAAAGIPDVPIIDAQAPQDQYQRIIPWQLVNARNTPYCDAAMEVLEDCASRPSHVVVSSTKETIGLGGSNILNDSGLVVFHHTKANNLSMAANAKESSDKEEEEIAVSIPTSTLNLRPERAKILSRLCQIGGVQPPPSKGSTLVVSISQKDLEDTDSITSLNRILIALGTFYNLLVLVAVSDAFVESRQASEAEDGSSTLPLDPIKRMSLAKKVVVDLLRQENADKDALTLSESILPSHRIVMASTVTGRVALVRQLEKVALVVDWEEDVQTQLTRFGYKVAVVPNWCKLLE
eukprot:Nitzschia sp. Nitz4//scaffold27_size158506//114426//115547//NITZ4_002614-RA/size158506-processed-gene-0.26-mRNA-1//1//CDS//3329545530//3140//frame0